MQEVWESIRWALGLDGSVPVWWQMSLRAIAVFMIGLVLVRVCDRRFLGKNTAFDVLLAVILGSILSRAINGDAPFLETVATAFILVGLHWLFAVIAFRSHRFGRFVKGTVQQLVKNGEMQAGMMRKHHISEHDFEEAMRTTAKLTDPHTVEQAYLERSGQISIIPKNSQPHVVEVEVCEGVQKVRIEFG